MRPLDRCWVREQVIQSFCVTGGTGSRHTGTLNGWPWLNTAWAHAGRVGSVGQILNHNAVSKVASVKCQAVAIAGGTCQRTPDCHLAT